MITIDIATLLQHVDIKLKTHYMIRVFYTKPTLPACDIMEFSMKKLKCTNKFSRKGRGFCLLTTELNHGYYGVVEWLYTHGMLYSTVEKAIEMGVQHAYVFDDTSNILKSNCLKTIRIILRCVKPTIQMLDESYSLAVLKLLHTEYGIYNNMHGLYMMTSYHKNVYEFYAKFYINKYMNPRELAMHIAVNGMLNAAKWHTQNIQLRFTQNDIALAIANKHTKTASWIIKNNYLEHEF